MAQCSPLEARETRIILSGHSVFFFLFFFPFPLFSISVLLAGDSYAPRPSIRTIRSDRRHAPAAVGCQAPAQAIAR
jgi:hypothetical protein